jgi:hypothetical protein
MVISGLGCNIFAKVLIFWDSTKDYREKREIIWNYAPFLGIRNGAHFSFLTRVLE